ncbi:hypothetical protein ABG768_008220 [Culter alburnus]|uniref:Uncharacterized protein n=1 Tax=Culter alburnus TaxID=194366 RepID=A0AAW1ZIY6_CULAL
MGSVIPTTGRGWYPHLDPPKLRPGPLREGPTFRPRAKRWLHSSFETLCRDCTTTRSLGMHRHHQHQEEVINERIALLQGKRRNWNTLADELLISTANKEWKEDMVKREHLKALQLTFPYRSSEALKKRLQLLNWKPPAAIQLPPDTIPI